jgi:hypothetical protein
MHLFELLLQLADLHVRCFEFVHQALGAVTTIAPFVSEAVALLSPIALHAVGVFGVQLFHAATHVNVHAMHVHVLAEGHVDQPLTAVLTTVDPHRVLVTSGAALHCPAAVGVTHVIAEEYADINVVVYVPSAFTPAIADVGKQVTEFNGLQQFRNVDFMKQVAQLPLDDAFPAVRADDDGLDGAFGSTDSRQQRFKVGAVKVDFVAVGPHFHVYFNRAAQMFEQLLKQWCSGVAVDFNMPLDSDLSRSLRLSGPK